MRFDIGLTTLVSLASAVALEGTASFPKANTDHPAISTFTRVTNQLQWLIPEIRQFDWQNPQIEALYHHAMETLDTLKKGNMEVRNGPELDMMTSFSFSSVLKTLSQQIRQMVTTLKEKKTDIDRAGVGLIFYSMLKSCYIDSLDIRASFALKEPVWMSPVNQGTIDDVIRQITEARDMFKPKEGDVDVVIVTNPNSLPPTNANQPGFPAYQYQPQNQPPPNFNQPIGNPTYQYQPQSQPSPSQIFQEGLSRCNCSCENGSKVGQPKWWIREI
jgi:hypothetical protein